MRKEGPQTLSIPETILPNAFYLAGSWTFTPEYAENTSAAKIVYKYSAKNVYLVASSDKGVTLTILRDGKPVGAAGGKDVGSDGKVRVQEDRLYHLIGDDGYGEHTLEIRIEGPELKAYTFTFG